MAEWVAVIRAEEMRSGGCRLVSAAGTEVLLVNLPEGLHAIANDCPHQGGSLAEGHLEGDVITCPWHGWPFSVRTGKHVRRPEIRNETYPVRVVDGVVEVEV